MNTVHDTDLNARSVGNAKEPSGTSGQATSARRQRTSSARRWHDMGGDAAGTLNLDEHDFALWEKRVDALMILCSGKGYFTVDGLRRALEDMGEPAFETMSYYERWMAAVNQNLIEQGVYSLTELAERIAQIQDRGDTYGTASLHDD